MLWVINFPSNAFFKILCLNVSACCKLCLMVSSILSQTVSLLSNSETMRFCSKMEQTLTGAFINAFFVNFFLPVVPVVNGKNG